jgi:hypothetical protein
MVLVQDVKGVIELSSVPFHLEAQVFNSVEPLKQAWLRALEQKDTSILALNGIEVLTPAEMEKKYGPPPARLAGLPWNKPNTFIAVANVSGHAAIAVFQNTSRGWKAVRSRRMSLCIWGRKPFIHTEPQTDILRIFGRRTSRCGMVCNGMRGLVLTGWIPGGRKRQMKV